MAIPMILWVDDELESLQSQKKFLETKGYAIHTLSNGYDALDYVLQNRVDVILLDESMPGISGLETLSRIKAINTSLPVVMITKNETENLMDEAIGSQISDYLIKPVNPNQVLLTLKKIIDNKRLVAEKTSMEYQQQFRELFMALNGQPDYNEWMDIYRKLVFWELEMSKSENPELLDVLQSQKNEANTAFFKFISKHYITWVNPKSVELPIMSNTLFRYKILPHIEKDIPTIWLLIDNLRFDQWKILQPVFAELFRIMEEETFYSILPTATQFSRMQFLQG